MLTELANFEGVHGKDLSKLDLEDHIEPQQFENDENATIEDNVSDTPEINGNGDENGNILNISTESVHSDWSSITDESSSIKSGEETPPSIHSQHGTITSTNHSGYEISSDDDTVKVKNSSVLKGLSRTSTTWKTDEDSSLEYYLHDGHDTDINLESEMEV